VATRGLGTIEKWTGSFERLHPSGVERGMNLHGAKNRVKMIAAGASLTGSVFLMATGSLAETPSPPSKNVATGAGEAVVVLPKFIVNADRTPKFEQKELFSERDFNKILAKRYPGMTLPNQPKEVDNYGLMAYRDEMRLEAKAHFENLVIATRAEGHSADAKELQGELDKVFLRRLSWQDERMDRNVNRNRR
jgi:hypothetical protein